MSIDCTPCQGGRRRPRQYTLRGKYSSAVVVGCTPPILLEYLPLAQAKPPGQDTKSQADTYVTGLHLYFLLEILTPGNTSAHVRGLGYVGSKRAWSSHQASASIRLAPHHAAWSRHMNDASRIPFCRGRGIGCHWHYRNKTNIRKSRKHVTFNDR
ncbi:hypothetical protein DPMN_156850 [Dreissena polymorpha]|uniref:Uncharacterized protein n=1 Tax=Dreissena polymorpha TaxID=45954 RepID=A0A9D4JB64_DREPO|nr:hypothetical protein DPMN_156850 [Dreissena polymorpha]